MQLSSLIKHEFACGRLVAMTPQVQHGHRFIALTDGTLRFHEDDLESKPNHIWEALQPVCRTGRVEGKLVKKVHQIETMAIRLFYGGKLQLNKSYQIHTINDPLIELVLCEIHPKAYRLYMSDVTDDSTATATLTYLANLDDSTSPNFTQAWGSDVDYKARYHAVMDELYKIVRTPAWNETINPLISNPHIRFSNCNPELGGIHIIPRPQFMEMASALDYLYGICKGHAVVPAPVAKVTSDSIFSPAAQRKDAVIKLKQENIFTCWNAILEDPTQGTILPDGRVYFTLPVGNYNESEIDSAKVELAKAGWEIQQGAKGISVFN